MGASKPVKLKERAEQTGAQVWEKAPLFHFYSKEETRKNKQRRKGTR